MGSAHTCVNVAGEAALSDQSPEAKPAAGRASGAEAIVDDVFGFDFKLPRTLRDTIVRPGRVADAALANDHSRYTRPLRMFLLISGVQLLVSGWLGFNDTGTFSVLFADDPATLAAIEARLAAAGSSLAEADEIIRNWTSWTTWPLIAVSSFLYVLVIWATRSRLGLLKSALLYIVASNAGTAVSLPVTLVGGFVGPAAMVWAAIAGFIILFAYVGLVLHRRAADTALGLAMRMSAIVMMTIPVLVVGGGLVLGAIELAFFAETGLSRFWLFGAAGPPGGA